MKLSFDIGIASVAKMGEELCGDRVEIQKNIDSTVVVLSDGLGSGVKANILATLTSTIAAHLMVKGLDVTEVMYTIKDTLPVCQVRKLAYATCTMLQINENGGCYISQFDNPPVLFWRDTEVIPLAGNPLNIADRNVQESKLQLQEGDIILLMSDGVTHAGIQALLPLGLGVDGIIGVLKTRVNQHQSAQLMAEEVVELCEAYSAGDPRDDITVVVIKARHPVKGVMLSGPPLKPADDNRVVKRLFGEPRKRVICGGTTANIVARERNLKLQVDLNYYDPKLPPCAYLEGIDLVTEGILTMTRVVEAFENSSIILKDKLDGASRLIRWLMDCDEIELLVGLSVNPAHIQDDLPFYLNLRSSLLERLREQLLTRGKKVEIHWF